MNLLRERVARKIKQGPNGCWIWSGYTDKNGYGFVGVDTRRWLVHRFVYQALGNKLGPDDFLCHHCDNPPCCNPGHMFVGTPADNQADSIRKKRNKRTLDEVAVRQIRQRFAAGGISQRELGERFGVHQGTISRVISRFGWKHVEA